MKRSPALLIAGTHSGCGKTTLTLGIMAALQRRGLRIQPFKCGPDFIDPTLHQLVTGRVSRNLDVRMCGAPFVQHSFKRNGSQADCAIIEGVMGLFDGGKGSAASLASLLELPVILVVDVRSAAESVAAVIKGFASLDPAVQVAGVICNRVGSAKHRSMISEAVQRYCQLPIVGFLPRNEAISIPSRHLGLHMGEEHPLRGDKLEQLIELIETHLDLELLLQLAGTNSTPSAPSPELPPLVLPEPGPPVAIGVARDEAFCFYYQDNLDLLEAAGAELVFFSPLRDPALPEGIQGLYLGGGYPELHAQALSANQSLCREVQRFADQGRPVYGECGGFMYLSQAITDLEGRRFPMAGVFACATTMQQRLRRLGYRQPRQSRATILGPKDTLVHGHEFHYSAISEQDAGMPTAYVLDDDRPEGYTHKNTLAGYVHLHWGRTPEVATRFVEACRQPLTT
ncbi:cobyrinate a,c-diamide synthase [Desulfogranum mediterraneum]|uniref:cobyrinate a,c-diamide synthase n=1 Tax=Desulfogranum mediterraneum TaxID=160661 RepID=UPI00042312F9|nr:cobyrinate a,c-diamide synthase [Desulfogranum mediterraneum]